MSDNPLVLQYSDGNLVPYQTPDPAQSAQRALDFTGIPDLVSGANALARGEYLPGLGQAAAGASAMLPLGKLAGAAKLGAELMPLGGLIKAWHGTPHLFEPVEHNPFGEFRDAAIGTGEGAQAYGHGHYVAGNPAVAEEYQKGLGSPRVYFNNIPVYDNAGLIGDELVANHPEHIEDAARALHEAGGDTIRAMQDLRWKAGNASFDAASRGNFSDAADMLESGKHNLSFKNDGSLLEVHILPDEHELLDWDARLAAQPEGVRKVIDQIHAGNEDLRIKHSGPDVTGENFYRNLANQMWDKTLAGIGGGSEAASKALHEAGIPGIKYLDQGSRNSAAEQMLREDLKAGIITQKEFEAKTKATSNYVIFDPKNLRIVGRNGQHLEPVEEDPFK